MPTLKCLSCDFNVNMRTRAEMLRKLKEHAAAHDIRAIPAGVINNVRLVMMNSAEGSSPRPGSFTARRVHRARHALD